MESVYVHIPFCRSICSYCDFCKMIYHAPWITKYLNALLLEINEKYEGEEIKTLYVGGGTPSCLNGKELRYLMSVLGKIKLAKEYEFTFECNLNDINDELLTILKDNGVNRLSIGIESFNQEKLAFMERKHTYKEAKEAMELIRSYGFNNVNFDLIYGIPNETLHDLKKDLQQMLSLKPDHISTYSLIIEDHTKISNQGVLPIDSDLDADMYEMICDMLEDNGFCHYEISNFSKDGFQSKHNLTYWNNDEYYGFGLGASGYTHGVRYTNTKSLRKYFEGEYRDTEEILSKEDRMYNELMLGFRKLKGINLKDFFRKYGVNMQEVFPLEEVLKDKELLVKDEYIYINPKYIYVMNEILIKIL